MSFAASSTASNRDERIFTTAFGMMDSNQDGEAVAAFMRVREILHRHGGGFRRLLERSQQAEQLNEELGRQNALLLRENAALRARDSRPAPSAATPGARSMLSMPGVTSLRNWDIGLIVIIAVWAGFGLLGATSALLLAAAVLIFAACMNWFSPVRFFAGLLMALAAYGTTAPQPSAPPPPTYAVAVAHPPVAATPVATTPVAKAPVARTPVAKPPLQIYAGTAAPATPPVPADTALRSPAEPRTRAKADCGAYRLQPGSNCQRGNQWQSYSDSERPPGTRSE
jgi:hypothetical protein